MGGVWECVLGNGDWKRAELYARKWLCNFWKVWMVLESVNDSQESSEWSVILRIGLWKNYFTLGALWRMHWVSESDKIRNRLLRSVDKQKDTELESAGLCDWENVEIQEYSRLRTVDQQHAMWSYSNLKKILKHNKCRDDYNYSGYFLISYRVEMRYFVNSI